MLTIINPTPRKSGTTTKGKAMAKKKGMPAGLKKYWAKVRSSKRTKNPSSPKRKRRAVAKRTVRNPAPARRRRVHRNPSMGGMFAPSGLFGELMTKEGLMMVAAVVATPTITELAVKAIAPTLTGYTRTAAKAAIGLGAAWAVHRFVNKKTGLVVGLVAAGAAVAEAIRTYQGAPTTPATTPAVALKGYAPYGFNQGNLNDEFDGLSGYAPTMDDEMFASEPGTVYV